MKHFVSMKGLSEHELMQLMKLASDIEENGIAPFSEQFFVGNLFFEPSTRTKMSFIVAQKRLGIEALDFHAETSSVKKGETIYDTAKTFESIGASLLVVRHPEDDAVQQLASQLSIPVINAGDGAGEHPTQSLLDLYTMFQEFGRFKGLNVAIVGDIKHSRVARSNALALQTLGANVYLSAKSEWQDDTLPFPYINIDDAVKIADVIMLLRVQTERHQEKDYPQEKSYLEKYGLTIEREQKMLAHAIIMHPAPVNRGVEIDDTLVEAKRSRIFKQMKNGVTVRMAVIHHLLQTGGMSHATDYNKRQATVTN